MCDDPLDVGETRAAPGGERGGGEGGDVSEERVRPERGVARGAALAEGLGDQGVPDGVQVCVAVGVFDVQGVAAAEEVLGVEGLVDVGDEV